MHRLQAERGARACGERVTGIRHRATRYGMVAAGDPRQQKGHPWPVHNKDVLLRAESCSGTWYLLPLRAR